MCAYTGRNGKYKKQEHTSRRGRASGSGPSEDDSEVNTANAPSKYKILTRRVWGRATTNAALRVGAVHMFSWWIK